jgi:hypothetical protein
MKERWILKQWREANPFKHPSIQLKEIKNWVPNLQIKMSVKDIKDLAAVVRLRSSSLVVSSSTPCSDSRYLETDFRGFGFV